MTISFVTAKNECRTEGEVPAGSDADPDGRGDEPALLRYAKPGFQMVTTNSPTKWKAVYAPGSGGGN